MKYLIGCLLGLMLSIYSPAYAMHEVRQGETGNISIWCNEYEDLKLFMEAQDFTKETETEGMQNLMSFLGDSSNTCYSTRLLGMPAVPMRVEKIMGTYEDKYIYNNRRYTYLLVESTLLTTNTIIYTYHPLVEDIVDEAEALQ